MTLTVEEVSAIVLECGTMSTRVGYSGDDSPQAVFPSVVTGRNSGYTSHISHSSEQILKPLGKGAGRFDISSKDMVEAIWSEAFARLHVSPQDYPLMLVDSSFPADSVDGDRATALELAFEHFQVPAVYFGKSAVMTMFSMGKHTGLVLETGASGISVVPVYEGIPLNGSSVFSTIGGDYLDRECTSLLESKSPEYSDKFLTPSCMIKAKQSVGLGEPPKFELKQGVDFSPAFVAYQREQLIRDFKESIVQVSESSFATEKELSLRPPRYYEFPCGYNKNYGAERYQIGDILFKGHDGNNGAIGLIKESLARLSEKTDSSLHPQYHHQLTSNLVVSGGPCLTNGFMDRLNGDIQTQLPILGKMRVQAGGSATERKMSAWLGASILSSLGTMQSFWLTKAEYADHGASILSKKFP